MAEEVILKSKEVFYRGQPFESLKKLSVREVAQYLPSRSRRSVLRNFQAHEKFIQHCEQQISQKKKIRTHLRDLVIMPGMVSMIIGIYNGKSFNDVIILPVMIGHRLGEFALTRTKVTHGTAGIGATKGSKTDKK
nr:30S ribosomal protein S19P [uncultured archaeon]